MRRPSLSLVLPGLVPAVLLAVACGTPFSAASGGGGDGGPEGGPEGGGVEAGLDGPLAEGAPPLEGGVTDAVSEGATPDGPAPAGKVVYVSTSTGDDGNDGLDPTKPRKTIGGGLVRAGLVGAGAEVHVCKGNYLEKELTFAQPIALKGAYDCVSWQRVAAYGYPTFDTTNLTVIETLDTSKQTASLVVASGATSAAVVDGFAITGASISTGPTIGVQVEGTAAATLSNDAISGGAGVATTGPGSVAVALVGGSPTISGDVIEGGTGTGNPGSAGILVQPGALPTITGDLITGGTGTAASITSDEAAVGIVVLTSLSNANAIKNVYVQGTDPQGCLGSSAGIVVTGSALAVDVQSSAISGGTGSAPETFSAGILVSDASGTTRVVADRIYGGARTGGGSQTFGVFVQQAAETDVDDCEIHGGSVAVSNGAYTVGVYGAGGSSPSIVDDTIFSGDGAGAAISMGLGVDGIEITDDLLLGGGPGTGETGVAVGSCSAQITNLDHTAFANFETLYACTGGSSAPDVPSLVTALPSATTTGDIDIESGSICSAAAWCVPDPACPSSSEVCMPSILGASWTTDDGLTGLFSGVPGAGDAGALFQGWTLPAGTPCALARGGTPVGGIPTDLFGQPRDPSKPTIGAFEFTATTCE
ncbi:MAG TPA: hypothetical protein VGG39_01020 [Polyangiaceae bacterium]|jgi:hypothetical protein